MTKKSKIKHSKKSPVRLILLLILPVVGLIYLAECIGLKLISRVGKR
jgi:hypothetical protein